MKISTLLGFIFGLFILSMILIGILSLIIYTVNFVDWKNEKSCDEVKNFAWNSPLAIPSELNEDVKLGLIERCYTFTLGGSSNGIKLFESGSYIGNDYFGNYTWDVLGIPHKD